MTRNAITEQHSLPSSVVQVNTRSTGDQEVVGSTPLSWQHSFVEIDHEIFSTVIPLQEGQLLVSGERVCTILVNRLED